MPQAWPTISSSLKKQAISIAAFSLLSEPWAVFPSRLSASSLPIVPGAASVGKAGDCEHAEEATDSAATGRLVMLPPCPSGLSERPMWM